MTKARPPTTRQIEHVRKRTEPCACCGHRPRLSGGEEFVERLVAAGWALGDIAELYGVSSAAICRSRQRAGLPPMREARPRKVSDARPHRRS